MNNNNIYFSCFSLIRACLSSLFDNFSKVVSVCLIVCIVLISPAAAFASTTDSMLMFSMRSADSGVMAAAVDSAQIRAISYNNVDDTYKRGTLKSITPDAIASFDDGSFVTNYISTVYSASNYEYGIEFLLSDLSYDLNGSLDLLLNGFVMLFETTSGVFPAIDFSSVYPSIIEADITYSGSAQSAPSSGEHAGNFDYGSWYSFSNQTKTLPVNFSSSTRSYDIKGFSSFRPGGQISLSTDSSVVIGEVIDLENWGHIAGKVRSGHITDITFRILFPVNYYDLLAYGDTYYSSVYDYSTIDNKSFYTSLRFVYDLGFPKYEILHSANKSDDNVLGKSIASLSSNISSKISSINVSIGNKITQSTNTITSKIDTMQTNIQQGLQNVVTSAQQNTQNIINTVTNKVNEVKTGITEVKDSILDLPNKLQEMLIEFIVPDAETMGGKYSEFTELLEEKLGVIYQIPAMILELFETLVSGVTNPQTTLTFPSLSLPWIDGTQMKLWDSIEFEIIPTGMDVLKDLIQTVTSMVCVIMTFNSVKRIYENFLRGR